LGAEYFHGVAGRKKMFESLSVGYGKRGCAKGSVNVGCLREDKALQVVDQLVEEDETHKVPNFVLADACNLPFKNGAFNLAFSNHAIEYVKNPFRMFSELHRVANRKVIVRCAHRRGSGAKGPFHVNYFDESWFGIAASRLGHSSRQFVYSFDYPISSRLRCPLKWQNSPPLRLLRHVESRWLVHRLRIPFEMESWSNIAEEKRVLDPVCFVVVSNDEKILRKCFEKGVGVTPEKTTIYMNKDKTSLPVFFNHHISKLDCRKDVWLVFCHQDFVLKENLEPVLNGLDANSIYGVIGTRASSASLFGRILQTDGTVIGLSLTECEPVQTVDEMCLIGHSSVFRKGLRFDCRFKFHFYAADLCLQAYSQGFGVYAVQTDCQHKSKDLIGDRNSEEFNASKRLFAEKWRLCLPIRTTTGLITEK